MSFNLENFVAAPSVEFLNLAKKRAYLDIADHYAPTFVKPSKLKHEIKNIPIRFLVAEAILDLSALSSVLVTQTGLQLRVQEIHIQVQLEKLKLEQDEKMQKEKFQREAKIDKSSWKGRMNAERKNSN